MSKKVLVIYYSQSGQLQEILEQFLSPFQKAGVQVDWVRVHPKIPYPLPWTGTSFFAVMPDCVLGNPIELEPFDLPGEHYDLVVLGYQAWFLSPSLPFRSLLEDPGLKRRLAGTPVVTITGARNMWISAMEKIKPLLKERGARLVANIALVDNHANLISFITIFHWMFTGRRDRYLGIFPKPGVSDADIAHSAAWGAITCSYLINATPWEGLQPELVSQRAVVVKYNLMFIESKARKIFAVWARIISRRKKRTAWLVAFKYYLLIALFIAAPIILTVDALFFKPFLSGKIKRQKQYYAGVN